MRPNPVGGRTEEEVRARTIGAADVERFVREELLSPARERPIVGVTTSAQTNRPWVDPDRLAQQLGGRADVVLIETGEATWTLNEELPERLDAYGGATRIWWPGLTPQSSPYHHPLFFARTPDQGEEVARLVTEAVLGPDRRPWERLAEEYAAGDVVRGRVALVRPDYALVELLPGACGLVHWTEVDYVSRVPADIVHVGERVNVKLLEIDPAAGRATLSLKQAWGTPPREPIALSPDGPLFLDDDESQAGGPRRGTDAGARAEQAEQLAAELTEEVETLRDERGQLLRRVRALEKELRGERDRYQHLQRQTAPEVDPVSSETAFVLGVRLAYARLFGEGERLSYPLRRMRVGSQFLARLRGQTDVGLDKVLDVCAQVACGRAHEIPAREVHQFREGSAGSRQRVRASDGARAWRCSLQDNTPAARRLHWWALDGADGGLIEFASVGVHDDYDIPE